MEAVNLNIKKENADKNKLNQLKITFSKFLSVVSEINALQFHQCKSNGEITGDKGKSNTEIGENSTVIEYRNTQKNYQLTEDGRANFRALGHQFYQVPSVNEQFVNVEKSNAEMVGGNLSVAEYQNTQKNNSKAHQFYQDGKIACANNNNLNMQKSKIGIPGVNEQLVNVRKSNAEMVGGNLSVAEYQNTQKNNSKAHQFYQDGKIACANNNNLNMQKSKIGIPGVNEQLVNVRKSNAEMVGGNLSVAEYQNTQKNHQPIRDGRDNSRVYNESEIEVEVVDHIPYTIGTNDELDVVNVDVIEQIDRMLTEPLHPEMADCLDLLVKQNHVSISNAEVEIVDLSEIVVQVVDHVPYTIGTNDELDTVNVDVFEPIDPRPTEPSSRQPYRLSIGIDPRHGCDKNDMFVPTSDQGPKKMCCVYCRKLFSQLVRHLETVHKDEKDVRAFHSLPIGSKERGQYDWNHDAKLNKGLFIPSRRPNFKNPRKARNHEVCANCFAPIYGKNFRQHWNRCADNSMKRVRAVKALGRAIEKRLHVDACDDLCNNIFPNMHSDDCVEEIRYDSVLTAFGNDLCLNYSAHYQQDLIKRHLRAAGKLLVASRSVSKGISDFSSILHVKNCNTIIEAIRIVSGFNTETKTFEHPSTAATSVTLVNKVAEVLLVESMKAENQEQETNVTRFSTVFQKEAKLKLNKIVGVMKEVRHRERDENIPSKADVQRLADYLDSEIDKCFFVLTRKYSYANWVYLAQLTMASIIVFNRRRVGEVKNILVRDFHRRVIITDQYVAEQCDDETPSDDALENIKQLIKSRMKIRGKLNRTVPVLLKHTIDKCLTMLISHRRKAGVPVTNNFLFALRSEPKRIRIIDGCALMRKFSTLCGAENPTSLRGTKLRKQFASLCSTMSLSDNDVTNVANFMGHDDRIHRDIYRHNPLQKEIVQMTRLLEAGQGRNVITNCTTKRTTRRPTKGTTAGPTERNFTGHTKRTSTVPTKHTTTGPTKRTTTAPTKCTTKRTTNTVQVATRKVQKRKISGDSNSAENRPKKSKIN